LVRFNKIIKMDSSLRSEWQTGKGNWLDVFRVTIPAQNLDGVLRAPRVPATDLPGAFAVPTAVHPLKRCPTPRSAVRMVNAGAFTIGAGAAPSGFEDCLGNITH